MQQIDVATLFARYRGLLLDAYGVLVDAAGVLPGAKDFVAALARHKTPYLIVTNDASRLPERIAARFADLGLPIPLERIVSSASLLTDYFAEHDLAGATTLVVGPPDAATYVARAGGVPVAPHDPAAMQASAVVVCDLPEDDSFAGVERTIDACMHALDEKRPLHLVLCNPDVIYPAGRKRYGLTSGAAMLLIEAALACRFAAHERPTVVRLGKPYPTIFAAACKKLGTREVAMVGDQLGTDIRGARDFGIESVLCGTGLTRVTPNAILEPAPDFYLPAVGAP